VTIRLRARRSVRPDEPPVHLRPYLLAGSWGWEVDVTVLGPRDPHLLAEVVGFCEKHSAAWSLGTETQVALFAGRLEGLRGCDELVKLLRGRALHPGRALHRELRVAETYLELVEAETVVLVVDDRALAFWDGGREDRNLVVGPTSSLHWSWEGLRLENEGGSTLITGWSREPTRVLADTQDDTTGLFELVVGIAPMARHVRVERGLLRTVWAQWLSELRDAVSFAGPEGVIGTESSHAGVP
jgi:hypothetical protein